ncbi:MAG: glycosyltransferase [Planctomycetes bacterium]|nr:glycosyltransferase [Planctomycetota bacterium]
MDTGLKCVRPPAKRPAAVPALDVSVVIPTRDREGQLLRVVRGFLAQDYPADRFEVVVSVDGSTDGTASRLAAVAAQAVVGITVVTALAGGPAAARNRGVARARGTIVLFVGDDTLPARDLVRRHVEAHRAHGDDLRLAVLGAAAFTRRSGRPSWMQEWMNRKHLGYAWLDAGREVSFYRFVTSNVSVKRALLEEVGGFHEGFTAAAAEDIELGWRLQRAGMRLFFHPEATADHVHPLTLGALRRRMLATGAALHRLRSMHPEVNVLVPPGRRRLRALCTLNPVKSLCFALVYAWSVGWTLAGWRRGARAAARASSEFPGVPRRE